MSEGEPSNEPRGAVRLSGQLICVSLEQVNIIREHLPEHIRLTRSEPGCLSFEVFQTDNPMIWRVEEQFTDRSAFESHQARAKASAWSAATKGIRREYQIQTES